MVYRSYRAVALCKDVLSFVIGFFVDNIIYGNARSDARVHMSAYGRAGLGRSAVVGI